jgi:MoxR-like ATPase
MPEGNELLKFAAAKKRWGWKATPPFRVEPPIDDAGQLARLFTGRQAELSRVILPLYNGRNVLVRGMLGVGKSAFILRVLHELDAQAKAAREKILPIYIYHFYGGTTDAFYRLILYTLSGVLADKDDEAKGIQDALRGLKVTAGRS